MKPDAEVTATGEIEAIAAEWVARRDAGLSPAEAGALERWRSADPRHAAALAFYDSAWSALARPAQTGAGGELEGRLAKLARRRRRRRTLAGAAAALVVAGVGFLAWPGSSQPVSEQSVTPSAVVRTPVRQVLPDGSVVELKGAARIEVDYTSEFRRVTLTEGEGHFEVQRDAARPFVVAAAGVQVRAVGTAFVVQLGATAVEVLVTEGRVAVDKPDVAAPAAPPAAVPLATVDAGRRVLVELAAPASTVPEVTSVPPAELKERLAWRGLRLEFTRAPLSEVVALFNLHAPPDAAKFAVDDPAAAAMRISGVFRADNTEALVLLLEGAFGLKAETSARTITLRPVR